MSNETRLSEYIANHILWSGETFGRGKRTAGLIKHIRSELDEIAENPGDLMEWVDVIILALDGAWRNCPASSTDIAAAMIAKQVINKWRQWPKIEEVSEDEPSEHLK